MSRVLVVPDINLNMKKLLTGLERARELHADTIVLMGNYFYYAGEPKSTKAMMDVWDELRRVIRNDTRIVPLIGEDDLNYMLLGFKTEKYHEKFAKQLGGKLLADQRFVPCLAIDGVLYSHAGVTTTWLRNHKIMLENELRFRLGKNGGAGLIESNIFKLRSWDLFLDEESCMRSGMSNLITYAPPNVKQVVGHTKSQNVENFGKLWFANSRVWNEFIFVKDGDPCILTDLESKKWKV